MSVHPVSVDSVPASRFDSTFDRLNPGHWRVTALLTQGAARHAAPPSVFALVVAWRERRFVAARCHEILALYWRVAQRHPLLTGPSLYREIVNSRGGIAALGVDAVLSCAEQSFAQWPVTRELRFRDIVHCLTVLEFLAAHQDRNWIHADLKPVVNAIVPAEL